MTRKTKIRSTDELVMACRMLPDGDQFSFYVDGERFVIMSWKSLVDLYREARNDEP